MSKISLADLTIRHTAWIQRDRLTRIVKLLDQGHSVAMTAFITACSCSAVRRARARLAALGPAIPAKPPELPSAPALEPAFHDWDSVIAAMDEGKRDMHMELSGVPVPKQEARMLYGKNVTLRHKNVAGIVVMVYVETESGGYPEQEWWHKAALGRLGRLTGSELSVDDWVAVSVS